MEAGAGNLGSDARRSVDQDEHPPGHRRDLAMVKGLADRYGFGDRQTPTEDDLILLMARVERIERVLKLAPLQSLEQVYRIEQATGEKQP